MEAADGVWDSEPGGNHHHLGDGWHGIWAYQDGAEMMLNLGGGREVVVVVVGRGGVNEQTGAFQTAVCNLISSTKLLQFQKMPDLKRPRAFPPFDLIISNSDYSLTVPSS